MALPVTKTFVGTNGTDLPVFDGQWTAGALTAMEIQGNAAESDVGGGQDAVVYYNGDTFNNDQYSEATLTNPAATGGGCGPVIRKAAGTTRTFYIVEVSSGGREWFKMVAGGFTYLGTGSDATGATNGAVYHLEAQGTTIRLTLGGVAVLGSPVTDSSIASGAAGIGGWDDGNPSVRISTVTMGNVGGGATNLPITLTGPGGGFVGQSRGWAGAPAFNRELARMTRQALLVRGRAA